MADAVFGKVTCSKLEVSGSRGRLFFDGEGNELYVESKYDDPPKVRLAAPNYAGSSISFNYLRPDGVHEEYFLMTGRPAEDSPSSLGGQLAIWCRKKNATGDASMVMAGIISVAYTSDGLPVLRLSKPAINDLGQWSHNAGTPSSGGGSTGGTSPTNVTVLSMQNLSGSLDRLTLGDGAWMTAVNTNLDTEISVNVNVTLGKLDIEYRRTKVGDPAPYIYVYIDTMLAVAGGRPPNDTSAHILTIPSLANGMRQVRVRTSAQAGTIEIGGFRG